MRNIHKITAETPAWTISFFKRKIKLKWIIRYTNVNWIHLAQDTDLLHFHLLPCLFSLSSLPIPLFISPLFLRLLYYLSSSLFLLLLLLSILYLLFLIKFSIFSSFCSSLLLPSLHTSLPLLTSSSPYPPFRAHLLYLIIRLSSTSSSPSTSPLPILDSPSPLLFFPPPFPVHLLLLLILPSSTSSSICTSPLPPLSPLISLSSPFLLSHSPFSGSLCPDA